MYTQRHSRSATRSRAPGSSTGALGWAGPAEAVRVAAVTDGSGLDAVEAMEDVADAVEAAVVAGMVSVLVSDEEVTVTAVSVEKLLMLAGEELVAVAVVVVVVVAD